MSEAKCEACGCVGGEKYVYVRTINGGLNLCPLCLGSINSKNPQLIALRAAVAKVSRQLPAAAALFERLESGATAAQDVNEVKQSFHKAPDGSWTRRLYHQQCGEKVAGHMRCQGVAGHGDVHWYYDIAGWFCWSANVNDPDSDGSAGMTPPGRTEYRHPVEMIPRHVSRHYATTPVTDPEEIARLERGAIRVGESISRPPTADEIKRFNEENPPRVILDSESVEHFRTETRPLLDRLCAHFGWTGDPVVTARSCLGHFFDGIRDATDFLASWERFCESMPFPVKPTDRVVDVARKLKESQQ